MTHTGPDVYEQSTRVIPVDVDPVNTDADIDLLDIKYLLVDGAPTTKGETLFEATLDDPAIELVDSAEGIYEILVPASAFTVTGPVTEEVRVSYSGPNDNWSTVERQRRFTVNPSLSDPP